MENKTFVNSQTYTHKLRIFIKSYLNFIINLDIVSLSFLPPRITDVKFTRRRFSTIVLHNLSPESLFCVIYSLSCHFSVCFVDNENEILIARRTKETRVDTSPLKKCHQLIKNQKTCKVWVGVSSLRGDLNSKSDEITPEI